MVYASIFYVPMYQIFPIFKYSNNRCHIVRGLWVIDTNKLIPNMVSAPKNSWYLNVLV